MSIFNSITPPTCPICQQRPCGEKAPGSYKSRCEHCIKHRDEQGIAFVIYCEFHKYMRRVRNTVRRQDVTFWVFEGSVQRAPVPYGGLVGESVEVLQAEMERCGYERVER